jgi:hypothetical protein
VPNWSTRRTQKPQPAEDLPDFDENFMSLLRQIMPEGVIPTGWPLYRRGGSYRHWTTAGSNNYVPTGFTQIGVYQWEGDPDSHVQSFVTFPRKFAGRPLVWLSILDTTPAYTFSTCMGWPNNEGTGLYIDWRSSGYGDLTHIRIAWLAMGSGSAA